MLGIVAVGLFAGRRSPGGSVLSCFYYLLGGDAFMVLWIACWQRDIWATQYHFGNYKNASSNKPAPLKSGAQATAEMQTSDEKREWRKGEGESEEEVKSEGE
jgi:hypothetical protein